MPRALAAVALCLTAPAVAASPLTLQPVPVVERVYAVIGDLGGQTYENDGLNANLGFIVTDAGVLVVNSGPTQQVAKALHRAITQVTIQPIRWVVNLNSQNHYWHGNAYFASIGANVIAHEAAAALMQELGQAQLESNHRMLKEKADDTRLVYPNKTFPDRQEIQLGATRIELLHLGPAHTRGDAVVWLPHERVLFAGDLIYTDRLLAVIPIGDSRGWIEAFDKALALEPLFIVPGHGKLATASEARRDTRDYLTYLREEIKNAITRGDDMIDTVDKIDQSRFRHLVNFDLLADRNVTQMYQDIEKE